MADIRYLTRVRLPPNQLTLPAGPRLPRAVQGALALTNRRIALQILRRRYGSAFSLHLPIFGHLVVLSDPSHIRQLFRLSPDVADTTDANLGRVMGPNSLFALSGDRHFAHRKLLTPPFHGRRLAAYERSSNAKPSTSSRRGRGIAPSRRCPR
jgi:cytochrome P450 family 138